MNTVVYDHQIFSLQQFGGVSRYFCEIAERIQNLPDWCSRIVAPVHFNDYLAASKVPTLGMHLRMRVARSARLYRATNALLAPCLLAVSGAEVLHRTYYSARPRPSRGRLVVTVHDMIHELYPQHFRANDPTALHKRLNIEAADHLICVSHSTANDLMRLLQVPRSKITVTHLGLSDAFRRIETHDVHRAGCRPYFLYVGQRAGYKNFARLLQAYGGSRRLVDDFDLVVFGGHPFSAQERQRMAALGLRADAVRRYTGSDAELARAYSEARAFVYPSEYEGFGIPLLEAMSRGCAVACGNTSSIPEVAGAAAEYFDPTSVDAIRSALEKLADDDQRRTALVEAGRAQLKMFSWDRCAAETIAAYRRALET